MEGQNRQKSEGVVILYKIDFLKKIKVKNYIILNATVINFILDLSNELKNKKKIYSYPELVYLMFWCSDKNLKNLIKDYKTDKLRLGRGLVFHICAANVSTNFVFSFIFGILSGNSNIIKIPTKETKEKKIILSILKKILNFKKYSELKKNNHFIQYNNNDKFTQEISKICDVRIIWGSDNTISAIRKFEIQPRSIELTFADRYSISVINLDNFLKLNKKKKLMLANKFFYDGYSMEQMACNSPHFIFWVGKKNLDSINSFWDDLFYIVNKKIIFENIHILKKYTNLIKNIISSEHIKNIRMYSNFLYTAELHNTKNLNNIRGVNGTFFQVYLNNLSELEKFVSKKCQTASYFGFKKEEIKNFVVKNHLKGIDRFVPIGSALEMESDWDGFNFIDSLSRIVTLK